MNFEHTSVEQIMASIRANLACRAGGSGDATRALAEHPQPEHARHPLPEAESYHVRDFLKLPLPDIIHALYEHILRRPVDPEGLQHYLSGYEDGSIDYIDITVAVMRSPEARAIGVPVFGLGKLRLYNRIRHLPVIRRIVSFFALPGAIVRTRRNLYRAITRTETDTRHTRDTIAILAEIIDRKADIIDMQRQQASLTRITGMQDAVHHQIESLQNDIHTIDGRFAHLDQRISDVDTGIHRELTHRTNTMEQALTGRIDPLEQTLASPALLNAESEFASLKRLVASLERRMAQRPAVARTTDATPAAPATTEAEGALDALYVAFEDRFRGTREEIKNRQRIYLDDIKKAVSATGRAPVLDVGCGRGEWLELLREAGIEARGVDLNDMMVTEAVERGLSVIHANAVTHLQSLPDDSLAAVTGFHIIEHLSFSDLITLFDESLRVVKPGGYVLFETPNPENILVGSRYFYHDPSHRNPLVPVTTQFLLEQRGFVRCGIKRVNPPEKPLFADDALNDALWGTYDFAAYGFKA